MDARADIQYNPYRVFSRAEWAKLRDDTPMTLDADEIAALKSLHDRLDMKEVEDIYLPLSRLLSMYVAAAQRLFFAQRRFLGIEDRKMPYIIGVAGSVAVGKSTTARVLQALLARWSPRPKVDLVTTDGFLFPNAVLERRGLMQKKPSATSITWSAASATATPPRCWPRRSSISGNSPSARPRSTCPAPDCRCAWTPDTGRLNRTLSD